MPIFLNQSAVVPAEIPVELVGDDQHAFAKISLSSEGRAYLAMHTTEEADSLIAAATEVKRLLAEAAQLYVVVNVEPDGRRVTVTDPMPKAEAERWAKHEAPLFAGHLEVRPATQADLDDAGEGA